MLERFACIATFPIYFILGAESENGACLAAVRTYKPNSSGVRGKVLDRCDNGFRPGKVPVGLRMQRLFSSDASALAGWRWSAWMLNGFMVAAKTIDKKSSM